MLSPGSLKISPRKAYHPENPVHDHGNPHADGAHFHIYPQDIAEADTEDPHGKNSDHHGIFYIVAGTEHVRQDKGRRPKEHGNPVMDHYKLIRQISSILAQPIKRQNLMQEKEHRRIA